MLDDSAAVDAIDRSKMLDIVAGFPEQIKDAITIVERIKDEIKDEFSSKTIEKIVISGMGGSAISGDIIQGWLRDSLHIPLFVNREYTVPAWVDKHTLSIFLSYSGNTEETLDAFADAYVKQSTCIGISSGGFLKERCKEYSCLHIEIPSGFQPRAATAYLLFPTIMILDSIGLIPHPVSDEIEETMTVAGKVRDKNRKEKTEEENKAKQIASKLQGTTAHIYGWNHFAPVAKRWRTQLNENSKVIARDDVVSECNHNDIVGWSFNPVVSKNSSCILLRDKEHEPKQIGKRFDFMKHFFERVAANTIEVDATGNTLLARMISLMYLGDFVSCYLAVLRKVDPTPVDIITELKTELTG